MQNIATPELRAILSENVKTLLGGFSQATLRTAAAKTKLSARTIAYMVSKDDSNPRLSTLQAFADGYRVTIGALLTPNLGRDGPASIPGYQIAEALPPPYQQTDPTITDIVGLLDATNQTGRAIVRDKARDIAREYPIIKENAA